MPAHPAGCSRPGPRQPGRVVSAEAQRDSFTGNWTVPACGQYRANLSPAAAGTITKVPRAGAGEYRADAPAPADAAKYARVRSRAAGWAGGPERTGGADGPPAGTGTRRVLRSAPDGLAGPRPRDRGCRRWRPARHRSGAGSGCGRRPAAG